MKRPTEEQYELSRKITNLEVKITLADDKRARRRAKLEELKKKAFEIGLTDEMHSGIGWAAMH